MYWILTSPCFRGGHLIKYPDMITVEKKSAAIKSTQTHKNDTGGSSAQVAVLTERIKELTEHLKVHKHDYMARRGLLQMVGKRRRLLRYIAERDSKSYLGLIQKLGIRR
jgi:small subunit ribosomal protein S15